MRWYLRLEPRTLGITPKDVVAILARDKVRYHNASGDRLASLSLTCDMAGKQKHTSATMADPRTQVQYPIAFFGAMATGATITPIPI